MDIQVYSASGEKKGSLTLPAVLFGAPINVALMHQAVTMQQANRRHAIAHAKHRGEVAGSTRKPYPQKHTGRARRGPLRSPLLRGGGKSFGPRKDQNFSKDMPHGMRRAALLSALSMKAKEQAILGLEGWTHEKPRTKEAQGLLKKLPVELGRRILIVLPEERSTLTLSMRNIPGVKTLLVHYLNPEDIIVSRHIIFLTEALKKAEEIFGKSQRTKKSERSQKSESDSSSRREAKKKPVKNPPPTSEVRSPKS